MADLISRTAAIAEVEQWAEHGHDVIHWTGIKAMLEIQPAVDAIPMEWLRKIQEGCVCDVVQMPMYVAIGWMIDMWHKEQEAR